MTREFYSLVNAMVAVSKITKQNLACNQSQSNVEARAKLLTDERFREI